MPMERSRDDAGAVGEAIAGINAFAGGQAAQLV